MLLCGLSSLGLLRSKHPQAERQLHASSTSLCSIHKNPRSKLLPPTCNLVALDRRRIDTMQRCEGPHVQSHRPTQSPSIHVQQTQTESHWGLYASTQGIRSKICHERQHHPCAAPQALNIPLCQWLAKCLSYACIDLGIDLGMLQQHLKGHTAVHAEGIMGIWLPLLLKRQQPQILDTFQVNGNSGACCFESVSYSKIHAAGSPLLARRLQASMWDLVRPAWQS